VARVPLTAVLDEGRGPTVFTVDPKTSRLAKVPVEIARYESADAVVAGGLKRGDRIVTLGVNRLEDGKPVRVTEAN
jgi:multidrug efflux pump subunit AcrA (membrane-fusion protein)